MKEVNNFYFSRTDCAMRLSRTSGDLSLNCKNSDCFELHTFQRYIKEICRKHSYLNFAVPSERHLHYQSNTNRDDAWCDLLF